MLAANLPSKNSYHTGWVTQTIPLGEEIQALDFHYGQNAYVIGTNQKCDFKIPDHEVLHDFGDKGKNNRAKYSYGLRSLIQIPDLSFPPQVDRGAIKLLDRATWSIIDQ